ncbi:MAG: ABC transporter substrate-binding protein [Parvibaculum sp.]|nr:ABC transporter substrate-binding protein [Parvibaculum sp.]
MRFLFVACLTVLVSVSAGQADAPKRVLSVGGAVTETVYALGAGDSLVAVDQTSLYPWEKTHLLPNVGYVRALAAEGLLSLKAEILLAGPEAGPPAILDQVEMAGLRVVRLPDGYTPDKAIERIVLIGKALDRDTEAKEITTALIADLASVQKELATIKSHPRVLFLLQAGRGAPMAGGTNTAADGIIVLAGGINAASDIRGYKPLSPEAAIIAKPDIIIMMKQSVDAIGGADKVLALTELAETPAVRNGKLIVIDGVYALGFGPRLAHAAHDLAAEFHPEHKFPPLPDRAWTKAQ